MSGDGAVLTGEPAAVLLAEPVYRTDGRLAEWREVPPRPRDSFLHRLFAHGELWLRPGGAAEARLASEEPLTGSWRADGPFPLVSASWPDGTGTLDGYLSEDAGGWWFDAVYTGHGRVGSAVVARVRQRFTPRGHRRVPRPGAVAAPDVAPAPAPDGASGPAFGVASAQAVNGASGPAFGVASAPAREPRPGTVEPVTPPRLASVEDLRTLLDAASLRGRWRVVAGPAYGTTVTVSSASAFAEHGGGFLRLARGPDVAVGLAPAAPGAGWELVVLAREDAPPLTLFGAGDGAALRRLGIELLAAGRFGQAAPILDRAAELHAGGEASTSTGRVIDLLGLCDARIRCAFAGSRFAVLPEALVAAADVRRQVTLGPGAFTPWLDTLRFLRETVEPLRESSRRIADLAGAGPSPSGLAAAAAECAVAAETVYGVLRSTGSPSDDPETIESSAECVDRALAAGQDALRETADRLAAQGAPEPGSAGELVLLSARGGADVLALMRDRLARSAPAAAARFVRDQAREAAGLTAGYVEIWRALLDSHWDKIISTDQALPFYERMVTLLLDLDASEDALVASEMARARAFADTLRANRATPGEPARGLGGAPPVSREGLRSILTRHDAVVVEYFLAGDLLTVWVWPRGGPLTRVTRRVDRAGLKETVKEFGRLARMSRHDAASRAAMAAALRRLGEVLWDVVPAGLLPADPDEPVTVVPHLELFHVPFAALRDASGTYLVQRHAIRVLPALAMIPDLTAPRPGRPANAPPELVALVNPRPLPEGSQLDWTQERFGEITGVYGEPVRLYTGEKATAATLHEVAGTGTVLYFGTHGRAVTEDHSDPMMSYLVLAPSAGHDGYLRALEVPGLGLAADLVILAACETGGGTTTADGVIGLSRAFLTSGPTGLITTLYPVGEQAGHYLMTDFHESWLLDGLEPVSALRHAQARAASAQRVTAQEPHLWAAFTFFGLGSVTRAAGEAPTA
ncbi:CHAT domain-containing protein [Microbispora cellulosiformans]|uniref:CHAT domain-containing protein n=1 Tax=Microbispora cellulosiformans TaxID=2614688 RepID=A0A5J5K0D1_9ACTN|nr:CHAT domain-containing protein [Microbispora cellulosiformans]KAA9377030.1 CHAT domain-containing protein [Microbispora cellulosiformans]